MESNTTPPQVPIAMTKTKLVRVFYPVPERELRSSINQIIIDNRRKLSKNNKFTDAQLIKKHSVLQCEILELFKEFGTPNYFLLKKINTL